MKKTKCSSNSLQNDNFVNLPLFLFLPLLWYLFQQIPNLQESSARAWRRKLRSPTSWRPECSGTPQRDGTLLTGFWQSRCKSLNVCIFSFLFLGSLVSNGAADEGGQVPFPLNSSKMLIYSCHMSMACKELHV